jgi:hypothetical protein
MMTWPASAKKNDRTLEEARFGGPFFIYLISSVSIFKNFVKYYSFLNVGISTSQNIQVVYRGWGTPLDDLVVM